MYSYKQETVSANVVGKLCLTTGSIIPRHPHQRGRDGAFPLNNWRDGTRNVINEDKSLELLSRCLIVSVLANGDSLLLLLLFSL